MLRLRDYVGRFWGGGVFAACVHVCGLCFDRVVSLILNVVGNFSDPSVHFFVLRVCRDPFGYWLVLGPSCYKLCYYKNFIVIWSIESNVVLLWSYMYIHKYLGIKL